MKEALTPFFVSFGNSGKLKFSLLLGARRERARVLAVPASASLSQRASRCRGVVRQCGENREPKRVAGDCVLWGLWLVGQIAAGERRPMHARALCAITTARRRQPRHPGRS